MADLNHLPNATPGPQAAIKTRSCEHRCNPKTMADCLAGLGKLKSPERKQGSEEEKGRRSKTEEEKKGIRE